MIIRVMGKRLKRRRRNQRGNILGRMEELKGDEDGSMAAVLKIDRAWLAEHC
jgi:hypothetical protein